MAYGKAKVLEVQLRAGDLLYLPAGWWHCVQGSEARLAAPSEDLMLPWVPKGESSVRPFEHLGSREATVEFLGLGQSILEDQAGRPWPPSKRKSNSCLNVLKTVVVKPWLKCGY